MVRRAGNRRVRGVFALIAAQEHDAYRPMRIHEGVEEIIAREQRVIAIGNQHGGFDLHSVGVQFAALMAKERVDRRDADLQQRKEGHVELGHVAELYQCGLATVQPLRLKCGREVVHRLIKATIGDAPIAVDNRHGIAVRMVRQDVGQRQILPVAFSR